MMNFKCILPLVFAFFSALSFSIQVVAQPQPFPLVVKGGELEYISDQLGNRILDFSYCGYKQSNEDIPAVPFAVFVPHQTGDCSAYIQRAIDYVSLLPANREGFRGTILLDKGTFELHEGLLISASGVVLQGMDKSHTILLKKGVERSPLLRIEGDSHIRILDTLQVASSYTPVNAFSIKTERANALKKGDRIFIVRPSTKEWIASVGCDEYGGGISALGWKPGDTDICWDRTVTAVSDHEIQFDAPLTSALGARFGGAQLLPYEWKGRISQSGVSNITLESDYNRSYPKDEDHCWTAISIENAEHCWVKQANFRHFAGSAVVLQPTASCVTVEDCISLSPVSEIGGMRRSTFLTYGQLNLFQRCYSEYGIHDFAAGYCAAGPNAFVQCETKESFGYSGSVGAWACGLLFDVVNIDGHNLTFKNIGQSKNGSGWNTANSLFWQCTAAEIECYSAAEDAVNRAYGCWAQFSGNGQWAESNNHVQPRSFFYAQLEARLGKEMAARARILPKNTSASSSPTIEVAMTLAQEGKKPLLTLYDWIDQGVQEELKPERLKSINEVKYKAFAKPSADKYRVKINNGRITRNDALIIGGKLDVPWWNGKLRTPLVEKALPHVTRFVPGREGQGLTDRIDSVITYMQNNRIAILDHNYGLWYDRRRDDHERVRRRDGDVWAPFYEQPFARGNSDKMAWDGMGQYDLTRPNAWYWHRLKEFSDKAARQGMLLFHQNYFQHNILEAGAHWVDSPWRTANNINETGFPEPVHFAGDKRIFVAEIFYDIDHPVRRALHRNYIRQCLDAFADNDNVVQLISEEYTGPLHFVEFWLDVIAEWEAETGKKALVALSTTKDVQDAILSDVKRASHVDIIDIRYWHYKDDGTLYAPEGGKNLAPRQHARKMKVGKTGFNEAYKAVNEYRSVYPDKAVTYFGQNYPAAAWAVLMAGGSCPALPYENAKFLCDVASMDVEKMTISDCYKLVKSGIGAVIFSNSPHIIDVKLDDGTYELICINPSTGKEVGVTKRLKIKDSYLLNIPDAKPHVYWFSKK